MLSFFQRGVLYEILALIGSVSEGFPTFSYIHDVLIHFISEKVPGPAGTDNEPVLSGSIGGAAAVLLIIGIVILCCWRKK